MGQTEYTGNFVENLFAFLRQLVTQLSKTFESGGSVGGGTLNWFASNWLKLVLVLIAACVIIDWLVWMVRWRPYWLWFRKKRIVLDDDFEDEKDEYDSRIERSNPQYHSTALKRGANARQRPPKHILEEDEFYEADFEDDDYIPEDEKFGDEDEFDELIRNTLIAEEEDPFKDMPRKPARQRRGIIHKLRTSPPIADETDNDDEDAPQDEGDAEEFFEYEDSGDDLFFDQDSMSRDALFPLANSQNIHELFTEPLSSPDEPYSESFDEPFNEFYGEPITSAPSDDPPTADGENPWRTGYTTRVPKIDVDSPELSRKMRRRLKGVHSDE